MTSYTPEVTPGIPDAAARLNPIDADRLVPIREGMEIVGTESPTSYYKLVHDGELPPIIKRGLRSYHLLSDLMAYLHRLASQRGATPTEQVAEIQKIVNRLLAGKAAKRAAREARNAAKRVARPSQEAA